MSFHHYDSPAIHLKTYTAGERGDDAFYIPSLLKDLYEILGSTVQWSILQNENNNKHHKQESWILVVSSWCVNKAIWIRVINNCDPKHSRQAGVLSTGAQRRQTTCCVF